MTADQWLDWALRIVMAIVAPLVFALGRRAKAIDDRLADHRTWIESQLANHRTWIESQLANHQQWVESQLALRDQRIVEHDRRFDSHGKRLSDEMDRVQAGIGRVEERLGEGMPRVLAEERWTRAVEDRVEVWEAIRELQRACGRKESRPS